MFTNIKGMAFWLVLLTSTPRASDQQKKCQSNTIIVALNIGFMVVTYLSLTAMIIDHTRYSGGFFHITSEIDRAKRDRKMKPYFKSRACY